MNIIMDLIFEKGDSLNPKGHALIYFRSNLDNDMVAATYIVVLPISVEISKYVPPFLMSQVGNMDEQNLSAFAFPPIPEEMQNENEINNLADLRKDDLLYGGEINLTNPTECMEKINDLVGRYTSLYNTTAIEPPSRSLFKVFLDNLLIKVFLEAPKSIGNPNE